MAQHHVPEDMLVAYAAGSLGESESLLVACHLTLCPECRELVDDAETIAAALALNDERELPPADRAGLNGLLARVLDRPDATFGTSPDPTAGAFDPKGQLPAPLYQLIGPLEPLSWHTPLPGVQVFELPLPRDDSLIQLVMLQPGSHIPAHRHPGFEATLVLLGGYVDDEGKRFVRGDTSLRDNSKPHQQWVDKGEPCLWLLVAAGQPILNRPAE